MSERTKLVTPTFTLAFANVFKLSKGDKPKYSIGMVFPKGADLSALNSLVEEAFKEKFPKKKVGAMMSPFKSGDEMYERDDRYANMEGCTLINASRNADFGPIPCVDAKRNEIFSDEEIYNGAKCKAYVSVYAWEYNGKFGVSFNVEAIQKVADGTKVGGKTDVSTIFDALETDESDGDNEDLDI
jgi:hypothetical protein